MMPSVPSWPPQLGTDHAAALMEIRRRADEATRTTILPHFTDHTLAHFDRVAVHFTSLIQPNLSSKFALSPDEIFVGIAACYLHDVALQSTRATPSARVDDLDVEDLLEIRKKHGELAAAWIEEWLRGGPKFDDIRLPPLGIDYNSVSKGLGSFVADLCRFHSGKPRELTNQPHLSSTIRLPILLPLLRMADALDLDSRRVRMENLDLWRVSPESLSHWWTHHYVSSVQIDEIGTIRVSMRFPKEISLPFIEYFLKRVVDEIERELKPAQAILRSAGIFLHLEKVTWSQEYSFDKQMPPQELRDFLGSQGKVVLTATEAGPTPATEKQAGKWGILGNPWTDLPISYRDEEFVLTEDLAKKFRKLSDMVSNPKGEIIALLGERGAGKSSFLENMRANFEKQDVFLLDVTPATGPISTAEQLYAWLYPRLFTKLTHKPPPEEVESDHFKTIVESYHVKRPIILIDNLDRYSEKPDAKLIRRFLQLSQSNLQALKRKAIVIISASDQWKNDIIDADLGYLGKNSIWEIERFTASDVQKLVNNRLKISGSSFERVFEKGSEQLIHKISAGNPRAVLETCRWLCEKAEQLDLPLVTRQFIEESFRGQLEKKTAALIHATSKESPSNRAGLEGVYGFYVTIERMNVSPDESWPIFSRLLQKGKLAHEEIPPRLQAALRHVAVLKSEVKDGREMRYWVPSPPLKELLAALKKKGLGAEDFVSYYRLRPVAPPNVDHAALLRSISQVDLEGTVASAVDKASKLMADATREGEPPIRVLLKVRFAQEQLIVAFLLSRGKELPPKYIANHEEGWFENEMGYRKRKSTHRLVWEMRELVKALEDEFPSKIESYPYIKLIQKKAEDYCYEDPSVRNWGKDDVMAMTSAIKKVYDEIVSAIKSGGRKNLA